jgi:hypothetical protein
MPLVPRASAKSRAMTRLLGTLALVLSPLYLLLLVRVGGLPIGTVTWAFAAFLMGTLLELLRLTRDLKATAAMVIMALLFSLANFVPYRGDRDYSLQRHLDNWP